MLLVRVTAIAIAALLTAGQAIAQAPFPDKPVKIIVTTPSGSGADFFARTLAQGLSDAWNQQVIVENRPGAGGIIGASAIAQADPDGYTLGIASTAHVVSPLLQKNPPYRPIDDFTPIALLAEIPSAIVSNAGMPAKNLQELIALARAQPGKLNYASLGDGTAAHLGAVIFNRAAHIDVVHVPFKRVADLYTALYSGDVQYSVLLVPAASPSIKNGKVRPLAVTSKERNIALPEVPSVVEAGLPGAVSVALIGVVAPANLPAELAAKIHADIARHLASPDTRERYAQQGAVPAKQSAADYAAQLRGEQALYRNLLLAIGLKPQ